MYKESVSVSSQSFQAPRKRFVLFRSISFALQPHDQCRRDFLSITKIDKRALKLCGTDSLDGLKTTSRASKVVFKSNGNTRAGGFDIEITGKPVGGVKRQVDPLTGIQAKVTKPLQNLSLLTECQIARPALSQFQNLKIGEFGVVHELHNFASFKVVKGSVGLGF